MTRKATHFGTCQICGAVQKLPGGKLAKHGYTVSQWGFFAGTCSGSDHKPFETHTDRIALAIEQATASRTSALAKAAELRARTDCKTFVSVYVPARQRGERGHYKW